MESPELLGDFEALENLTLTLRPIFSEEVGPRFLAWAAANARAWEKGEKQTGLTMAGQRMVPLQCTVYTLMKIGLIGFKLD